MKKAILFIIDGLGDLPHPETGKTPLQTARLLNFERMAKEGSTGLMSTISNGVVPGSDVSHLQILGYDPKEFYPGRGPLEAYGANMELKKGDVAFRANFATLTGGKITDRRAGRIDSASAKKLESTINMKIDGVQFIFKATTEHRGALVMRGKGLSANITDSDPHHDNETPICKSLDKKSAKTAKLINKFTSEVYKKLNNHEVNKGREKPANVILLRSAGIAMQVPKFQEQFKLTAACIAGGALYKGIAKYLSIDVIEVDGATGDKNTSLTAKGNAAVTVLKNHDFVFLHVKACDSFGHDGDFEGKTNMLKRIDAELLPILRESGAAIIITGDHSTPCIRKAHSGHEVPILIWAKGERVDGGTTFDEIACMKGGIGHIRGKNVMPLILDIIEKAEKYGS
ncbi:MAG: 2,3-bisphosphoglycerate-independent phosphoglycerate mutase [Candidatus Micrarchaeota archaeon]|nr:2,3-bisphosphoglycerate-independent phosphoglycerate mutase [Candidatus Micrarchaeota archaeon]